MVETIAPNTRSMTPSSLQAKMQAANMLYLIGQVSELRKQVEVLQAEVHGLRAAPSALFADQRSPTVPDVIAYLRKSVDVLFANQRTNHAWAREILRDHAVAIDELTARTMPWMIEFTDEVRAITGVPAFCDPAKLPQTPAKPKS